MKNIQIRIITIEIIILCLLTKRFIHYIEREKFLGKPFK